MTRPGEYHTVVGALRALIRAHQTHTGADWLLLRRRRNPMIYQLATADNYLADTTSEHYRAWQVAIHLHATDLARLSSVLQLDLFSGSDDAGT